MWVRLDPGYLRHPKVVRAGRNARDLDLAGMLYAGDNLTDGAIPREALRQLAIEAGVRGSQALAARLVQVGRWEETPTGYAIHDFLQYNPTREEVLQQREASAKRQAEWRKRATAKRNGVSDVHGSRRAPTALVTVSPAHDSAHDPAPSVSSETAENNPSIAVNGTHRSRDSARGNGAAVAPEYAPILEVCAHDVAEALGEKNAEPVWADLSAAFWASGRDAKQFIGAAMKAAAITKQNRPSNRRAYFRRTVERLSRES